MLDVVDGGVGDADSIAAQLRQMTTILDRDVNETDIAAGIAVRPLDLDSLYISTGIGFWVCPTWSSPAPSYTERSGGTNTS